MDSIDMSDGQEGQQMSPTMLIDGESETEGQEGQVLDVPMAADQNTQVLPVEGHVYSVQDGRGQTLPIQQGGQVANSDNQGLSLQGSEGQVMSLQGSDGMVLSLQGSEGQVLSLQGTDGQVLSFIEQDGQVLSLQGQDGQMVSMQELSGAGMKLVQLGDGSTANLPIRHVYLQGGEEGHSQEVYMETTGSAGNGLENQQLGTADTTQATEGQLDNAAAGEGFPTLMANGQVLVTSVDGQQIVLAPDQQDAIINNESVPQNINFVFTSASGGVLSSQEGLTLPATTTQIPVVTHVQSDPTQGSVTQLVNLSQIKQESPQVQEEPDGVSDLDPQDFVDVITSYKCKFCSQVFKSAPGINSHVRHVHLKASRTATGTTVTQPRKRDPGVTYPTIIPGQNIEQLPSRVQTSSSGTKANKGIGMESVATDTSDAEASDAKQETTSEVGTHMPDIETKDEDNIQDDDAKPTEAGDEENDGNKELFLCGQCNLGFGSIEACKEHMESDHGLNMDSAVTETMMEMPGGGLAPAAPGTKVDASTQVDKKKPGRKSKATLAQEAAEKAKQDTEKEANEQGEMEEDQNPESPLSDTELEENKYYDWSTRSREGKRRVKPPKNLTDDYYLVVEKSKTAVDMRKKVKSKYHLRCPRKSCVAKFKTEEGLALHDKCHNEPGSAAPYTCPSCSGNFDKWPVLKNHLWTIHQQDADLFSCDQCDFRTDILHKLELHLETHADTKGMFVCESCPKMFKQQSQLELHEATCNGTGKRSSAGAGINQHVCLSCKRTYTSAGSLKTHIQTVHEKTRTFACPQCPYTSTRKAMAEMHIRTHTGEKPYKCDLCDFATGDHNSFRRHRMRHTGVRPYKCKYCSYTCIQAASLKVHIKKAHPGEEGIYSCSKCSYRTINEQNWRQHQLDHEHGGAIGQTSSRKHRTQHGEPSPKRFRIHIPAAVPPAGQQPQGTASKALLSLPGLTRIEGAEGVSEKQAQLICSAINMLTRQMNPTGSVPPEKISVRIHRPTGPIDAVPGKEVYVISTDSLQQPGNSQLAMQPDQNKAQSAHTQPSTPASSQQTGATQPEKVNLFLPEGMSIQTVQALPQNDQEPSEQSKELVMGTMEDDTGQAGVIELEPENNAEPQNLTELTAVTVASQEVPGIVRDGTESENMIIASSSTASTMTVLEGVESVSEFVVAGSSSPVQAPDDATEQTVYHVPADDTEGLPEH